MPSQSARVSSRGLAVYLLVILVFSALMHRASWGATLWIDADPGGTTSNVNISGAVVNSGTGQVTNWGTHRDYRFVLSSSPSTTIGDVGLRLSVSKSSAGFSAPLNVTWFKDSITPYAAMPDINTALGTVGASDLPTGPFSAYVIGPGSLDTSFVLSAPTEGYWIRIWSATTGGNDKYQTKLAPNAILEYESTSASVTMYNFDEGTGTYSTTPATTSSNIVVPEASWPVGSVMACGGVFACLSALRQWWRAPRASPALGPSRGMA